MGTWTIGDVTVTQVIECEMRLPPAGLLPEATPEAIDAARSWLSPHFLNDDATITLSIHTFVVETRGMRVLVDTCVGNDKAREIPDWNMRRGSFLEDLEAAGFPPESFDRVVCTHLHVDHVGWNTRLQNGRWAPTFPRARYLIGRAEWEFWREVDHPSAGRLRYTGPPFHMPDSPGQIDRAPLLGEQNVERYGDELASLHEEGVI